ncbi:MULTISPECIES: caspase, EACC1-associated type [unclassified Streptomyces]|uniref:caspase, EACC1-associated type n=1 Tax=unclassified Streptomyces TaxID=2593676 RepID=UPI001660D085|nr:MULTISPECIES: caspase family protein [unclassified Streptomyces]MBD0712043.1 hypothetical protein [Streptomyces sp. CBMA291]MBD0717972.1 hypothetical protein [Streptomyces sp. CBMA370]
MEEKPPSPGRSRAVLIASGLFADQGFADLDSVARTAAEVEKRLTEPAVWGIDQGNSRVIEAHGWTSASLLNYVARESRDAVDCFVLYFAGHGVKDKKTGKLLLPLHGSTPGIAGSMLEFGELLREVGKGPAKMKIVLVDCCHAGLALGELPFEQHVADGAPEGCYVIAACEANRAAKAPVGEEFTAFGKALIGALRRGGPPDQEFWSPQRLFEEIAARMTGEGHFAPVSNAARVGDRPWLKNLAHRPVFAPAALPGPASGESGGRSAPVPTGIRHLGPDPVPLPDPFVGRDGLLVKARRMVGIGEVLSVTGREQVGKSTLIAALVTEKELSGRLPLAPVVLEIEPNSAAESPLLEAIARALHQTLDDSELSATLTPRTDSLLGLVLPRQVKGRSLVLVIKGSRVDFERPELAAELDELLAQDVFRRAAIIVETTDPFTGDRRPGKWLGVDPLDESGARDLLRARLAEHKLFADLEALEMVGYVDAAHRPGIIDLAVRLVARQQQWSSFENFLADIDTGSDAAREVTAKAVDDALVEAASPVIHLALERTWSTVGTAEQSRGEALLAVWGIVDELPVPVTVLQDLGLPMPVLKALFEENILVPASPPADAGPADRRKYLQVSPVSREALRAELLRVVRTAGDAALRDLDRGLTDAARLLGSAVLPDGRGDGRGDGGTDGAPEALSAGASDGVPPAVEVLLRATGWLDLYVPDALVGLRRQLGLYANSQRTEALMLSVAQTIDTAALAELPPPREADRGPATTRETPEAPDAPETSETSETSDGPETPDAPEAAGAPEAPVTPASHEDTPVHTWAWTGELYTAAGRLNVASRVPAREPNAGTVFLAVFEHAVSLLEGSVGEAPWQVLRAVDQCAFRGARRLRVLPGVVRARVRLVERLAAHYGGPVDGVRLNHLIWSVSWSLNTVAAQLAAQDRTGAGATLRLAEQLIEALPPAPDDRARQTRNWLDYRLARVRHLCAPTAEARRAALSRAYGLARENTLLAVGTPERLQQWTRHLLVGMYGYAQETGEDRERLELARDALTVLEEVWGPRSEWEVLLLTEVAGFLRRVHARHADSELQYEGAREVLALLRAEEQPAGGGPETLTAMSADHLTELAAAYGFLAYVQRERNEQPAARQSLRHGVQIAQRAAHGLPSAYAYRTWLRLLRTTQAWFGAGRGQALLSEHAKAVEEIRGWLASGQEVRYGNRTMAQLDLWCLDSDWQKEGSLPVAVKTQAVRGGWDTGRNPNQVRADKVHRDRWAALQWHERLYGPTWALYEARFGIKREYQRWSAIYAKRPKEVDHRPVWELLDGAAEQFPGNLGVMRARAFYHRYIWEYEKAARLHAETARQETDGDRFRQGLVDAAECLLSHALYAEGLTEGERGEALVEASERLEEVAGLHSQTDRVALLTARVALELGRPVDWSLADAKYADMIGDDFVRSAGPYLDERGDRPAPEQGAGGEDEAREWEKAMDPGQAFALDDLMENHFADADVLKSVGSLYLRRSVLGAERDRADALDSAWRAYRCFDGSRVMEESAGTEKVDTSFLRGQTITWAAELASAEPFAGKPRPHRGWLHEAERCLQSARDRSAGGFHEVICAWERRLRDARAELRGR